MKFYILHLIIILCVTCSPEPLTQKSIKTTTQALHPLVAAYPQYISKVENNLVYFINGKTLTYDDQIKKNFETQLQSADIEDMLFQDYPLTQEHKPKKNDDPGRFRNDAFFKQMYGLNQKDIEKKLTTIIWMPGVANRTLRCTTINDIDKRLMRISEKLLKLPVQFYKYVDNPGGSFNYRSIAGTNRLSAHSFGIAIDINIKYSNYWRWDQKKSEILQYKNHIPKEIISIFEEEGFIWGGKWYHYDTMHFEYRPELFIN